MDFIKLIGMVRGLFCVLARSSAVEGWGCQAAEFLPHAGSPRKIGKVSTTEKTFIFVFLLTMAEIP